ncbi:hypothetical protein, partial [Burkholderia sp. 3C]
MKVGHEREFLLYRLGCRAADRPCRLSGPGCAGSVRMAHRAAFYRIERFIAFGTRPDGVAMDTTEPGGAAAGNPGLKTARPATLCALPA